MVITRKIEIGVERINEDSYQKAWNTITYLDDHVYKAANTVVSHQYFNNELKMRMQTAHPEYRKLKKQIDKIDRDIIDTTKKQDKEPLKTERKELFAKLKLYDNEINEQYKTWLNTSVQNSTYQVVSELYPNIQSNIRTNINAVVQKNYNAAFKDLAQGKRSLPTYKKGMPIPFSLKNNAIYSQDDVIYLKWFDDILFHFRFGRDRSNNRSILQKVFDGTYKTCDSSIQLKDKKLFLLLVVDIGNPILTHDANIVVGIDLGINIPLYAALNQGYARMDIGSRDEFLNVRLRLQAQRRQLQRNIKDTQGGRGRDKKLSALDRIKEKETNFVKTQNHLFSKRVIEFAIKNGAGVIKMEKLTGIGEDNENKFLTRNWSYFELQALIAYKAEMSGIKVQYIDPRNTSKTCSFCGHLEDGQRLSQSEFQCKNKDCTNKDENGVNKIEKADYNGARNIALSTNIVAKSSLT
jgi:IS605 OrfB family transposase